MNDWIYSLRETNSAKNQYPKCIKTMFDAGYNEDRDIIRIKNQPFRNVKIPSGTVPEKCSIDKESLLKFFSCKNVIFNEREQFAQSVYMLSFRLVGMNIADVFNFDKGYLKDDWKRCYHRKRPRNKRGNGAYIEIHVPQFIRPIFEKYKGNIFREI